LEKMQEGDENWEDTNQNHKGFRTPKVEGADEKGLVGREGVGGKRFSGRKNGPLLAKSRGRKSGERDHPKKVPGLGRHRVKEGRPGIFNRNCLLKIAFGKRLITKIDGLKRGLGGATLEGRWRDLAPLVR